MTVALQRKSNLELIAEAERLPESLTGEVIDGELYVMGRPSGAHQCVEAEVATDLRRGGGGGGWLILPEVEVRFPTDELIVPDLTGWRQERIAGFERQNPFTIRPDWVCEILSDSTRIKDLGPKRSLYARHAVPHLWVIDPEAHILESFGLDGARWVLLGMWSEAEIALGVEPFPAARFELGRWWLPR